MVLVIHSFIHGVDVDFPAWIKHCLKPLGYVRKQGGQNPGSQELTLQQRRQREKSYRAYVCVYKVNDENSKEKKSKRERKINRETKTVILTMISQFPLRRHT